MNQHAKVIGRSLLSLAATLVIGGGVTYALFTSNQVTVSQTQISTGSADLRICNSSASNPAGSNTWKDTISPVIDFSSLNPGSTGVDITAGHVMYLGNDDGSLGDALVGSNPTHCTSYESSITPGNSTVGLRMVPALSTPVCTVDPSLANVLELRFDFGGTKTQYRTLTNWVGNTTSFTPTFLVGEAKQFKMEARLDDTYTTQGATCTFDVAFTGQQA